MKVLVYGASGQLGQSVVEALRQRNLSLRLGGRNQQRLEALSQPGEECRAGLPADLTRGCGVVVNCSPTPAGPLVEASLSNGAHYLDLGSEQARIRWLLDRFHQKALGAGVCLVPAMGFDYAVGDCLARLAAAGSSWSDEVTVAYALEGRLAASNSLEFATSGPRQPELVYRDGAWKPVPWELDGGQFDFPSPVGRRQVGRYGAGEVITIPRHTRTRTIRTVITASSLVPHPALLPFFSWLRPMMTVVLKTPLKKQVSWMGRLLSGPAGPPSQHGPAFTVVAEVRRGPTLMGRTECQGQDCYLTTAEVAAQACLELLQGKAQARGALPPSVVFSPGDFLDQLHSLGWNLVLPA